MITEFAKYNDDNYKVGDYVKIKLIPDYVVAIDKFDEDNLFTKIVEIEKDSPFSIRSKNNTDTTYAFMTSEEKIVVGNIYLIRRKMTEKEIEEYKLREEANKYNL